MHRLTKAEQKDRDRIEAWLKGEPFREYSRSTPAIPELSLEDVIETYVPPDIQGAGQFFTPLKMAMQAYEYLDFYNDRETTVRILEPAAGIGNLLYPFRYINDEPEKYSHIKIDAFDMERECVEIGRKLYPFANWTHDCTHDYMDRLEGQYDFVLMNPPFNTKRGMYDATEKSQSKVKNSGHLFLELAIRALKPGGRLVSIAPENFLSGLPKSGRKWFDEHAEEETNFPLQGEFRFTGIRVNLFCITKIEQEPEPEPLSRPKRRSQHSFSYHSFRERV